MRLIDPIELKRAISVAAMSNNHKTLEQIIDEQPTIEERKTGKWIETDSNEPCWFKCDQCGRLSDIKEIYCPTCGASMANTTCGADMRGEQNG